MKTFRLRRDAKSHKRKVEGDENTGLLIDPRGGETIFGPYAASWIEHRLVRGRPLTPATAQGYRRLLARNIKATFAKTSLRKMTPERVREWHSTLVADAGADQPAKSYRLLRAILNTALADDLISRNPCRIAGDGTEHAPERPILDTATVLDLADTIDSRLRAFVLLAGFGGLRPGELFGLERQDIDPLRGTVHVRRETHEIAHVRNPDGSIAKKYGRTITEPKSQAGKRNVALPRVVMDELRAHVDAFAAPGLSGVIFTRSTGRYLRRRDLSEAWKTACETLGLEGVHPHDLRHHAATTMARIPGVTTRELMARIGHSSPRAALIYQHATEERDRAVADHLDTVIASTERSPRGQVVNLPRDIRAMESTPTD
ncbi:MAG TPA: site-specific integrase [Acidimicrobiales bacterium]|nr:site-specific integrase [Acidimicrobiales bacterium]